MRLNIIPKSPSVNIRIKSIDFNQVGFSESEISVENFLADLEMEVRKNPRKAMKLKSSLIAMSMTLGSILVSVNPTATIDPDIQHALTLLMITCAGLGVFAAVIGLMAAAVWRMFFGKRAAEEWRENIYRGLGQLLAAPVTVALIVGLAVLLFSSIPAFKPMIEPITAWFQH